MSENTTQYFQEKRNQFVPSAEPFRREQRDPNFRRFVKQNRAKFPELSRLSIFEMSAAQASALRRGGFAPADSNENAGD